MKTVEQLEKELEKARQEWRYYFGNKKGLCWGRMTGADVKRSQKIDSLLEQLEYAKQQNHIQH